MGFWDTVKADHESYGSFGRTFPLVFSYRLGCYLFQNRNKFIQKISFVVFKVFYRFFVNIICGFDLDYRSVIGPGLQVFHGQCIVIGRGVRIGKNAKIRHATTIGNKGGNALGSPVIGDNVNIGSNSVIIGEICIGDNVVIGAGSVVVKNVADKMIVAGNPAKSVRESISD